MQGSPASSHLTQPSLTVREGFEPLPKPLANHWQGDVVDSEGNPLHQNFGMALQPLP